jgi:hypothetical protein
MRSFVQLVQLFGWFAQVAQIGWQRKHTPVNGFSWEGGVQSEQKGTLEPPSEQLRHQSGQMGQLEFRSRKYPVWHAEQDSALSQETQKLGHYAAIRIRKKEAQI